MSVDVKSNQDFGGVSRLLNLPAPASASEAATRDYVDNLIKGLAWKDDVRVASSANINLAAPGATIDGATMAAGEPFLAYGQTTAPENGIYVWNGAAVPATRRVDADTGASLVQAIAGVAEGTSAGVQFRQTAINITLGTTAIAWTSFSTGAPSATETLSGTLEIATQPETDAGTDDVRAITPLKLATYSGRKFKFSATIGDGSATTYTVTHNFNTTDVMVAAYLISTGAEVIADNVRNTANAVQITFTSPPATNAYRVVVLG